MFHVIRNYRRVDRELVEAFAGLEVATVHEAYGKRGALAAAIKPLTASMRLCGPALTAELHAGDNLILHKALDIASPGDVLVVDAAGWEGGPWGELMTVIAQAHHLGGLVIDGFVRDITLIQKLGFPVFARGSSVKGTFKEDLGLLNHPVSCGGVSIQPGDLVLGDEDGVCAVAVDDAEEVLVAARARDDQEVVLRRRFAAGETLWEVAGLEAVGEARGLVEEATAEGER
jgi:4-hydroxy-4-methyl-2-oxoglutarate aldolase